MSVMFDLRFSDAAIGDLRSLRKPERALLVDTIEVQLSDTPAVETRHRKPLRPNEISSWELRVREFREFYDVDVPERTVLIKAVGRKEHNLLYIRGQEFKL